MRLPLHYVLRWPQNCSSFMHSPAATYDHILHQPWKEIRKEDLASLARDHRQFCHPVITIQYMYICTVNIPGDIILKRERSVVLMYDRTNFDIHVNAARMTLFSQMSRKVDNILPTQAGLDQHIKRSSYQRGKCGTVTRSTTCASRLY